MAVKRSSIAHRRFIIDIDAMTSVHVARIENPGLRMISASTSLALGSTDLVETVGAIRKVAMEVVIMSGVVFRGQDNIEDPVEMELLDKPL